MPETIILGAGLAGLTAARHLQLRGQRVAVIDKGRGVGGRLATRRIGAARFDHGAQFFTTRSDAFKNVVGQAIDDGAVREWCRGFAEEDGYPRYCGSAGMTDFAKWMARDLDVSLAVEIDKITCNQNEIAFVTADGSTVASAPNAIVTAPLPQMHRLLDKGKMLSHLPPELAESLGTTQYFATLALLATIEGSSNVAEPGGMQFESGPFTFVADNYRKGISPVPALTFHAEHDYSLRRFDDDESEVHAELLAMAKPWIGDAVVVESQLKKWRYAGPVTPLPHTTHVCQIGQARLVLAGDAWAGPKVEGAFTSGLAAAVALAH